MYWTPPIPPQVSVVVRFDFVRIVIGSELQLKMSSEFRQDSIWSPPNRLFWTLFLWKKILRGYRGASGSVP